MIITGREQQQQCLFASGATGIKLVILLLWKRVTEATRRLNWNWKWRGDYTVEWSRTHGLT